MPDLRYGTLRLNRGATTIEITRNPACVDDGYRTFIETLKAADSAVATWGRAGRVLQTQGPDATTASP